MQSTLPAGDLAEKVHLIEAQSHQLNAANPQYSSRGDQNVSLLKLQQTSPHMQSISVHIQRKVSPRNLTRLLQDGDQEIQNIIREINR